MVSNAIHTMYGDKRGLHHGLVAVDESLRTRIDLIEKAFSQNQISVLRGHGTLLAMKGKSSPEQRSFCRYA